MEIELNKNLYKKAELSIKIIQYLLLGSADTIIRYWSILSFETMKFAVFICLLGVTLATGNFGNVGIGLVSVIETIRHQVFNNCIYSLSHWNRPLR